MSNTEQISLKHLSHAIPNPNPECLFCIRIAVGKHSSLVLICSLHWICYFLSQRMDYSWQRCSHTGFYQSCANNTVFYTLFTLIRGERDPAYCIGMCEAKLFYSKHKPRPLLHFPNEPLLTSSRYTASQSITNELPFNDVDHTNLDFPYLNRCKQTIIFQM